MEADCIVEDDRDFVERYIPSPEVQKTLKPGAREDYSDVSITIRYPDREFYQDHIKPIYLEKVKAD